MHLEEKKRNDAKWAVIHCPWDKVRKTNIPTSIVSPLQENRDETEKFLAAHFPKHKRGEYEYGVLKTDGTNIYL